MKKNRYPGHSPIAAEPSWGPTPVFGRKKKQPSNARIAYVLHQSDAIWRSPGPTSGMEFGEPHAKFNRWTARGSTPSVRPPTFRCNVHPNNESQTILQSKEEEH